MSRQRFIYPEMFTSEDFTSLSMGARLLFVGLIATADDEGRGRGGALCMKAAVFPADEFTQNQVMEWAGEISKRTTVTWYQVAGATYYQIVKWNLYQKPKYKAPSKIPCLQVDAGVRATSGPLPVQISPEPGPDPETGRVGLGREGEGREGSGKEAEPAQKPRSRQKAPAPAKQPKPDDPDNPGAGPKWTAFKDWAYQEWKTAGNAGAWGLSDWTRLSAAYVGFVKTDPDGGVDSARQSWLNYLSDPEPFYAGHYPKKWATEPSRWLEPKKLSEHPRTARNNAAMKQYLEEVENGTRPLIGD